MTGRNRDVFGLCREGDLTQIALLFVRGGRMIGQKTFPLIRLRAETGEILSSLLLRYYDGVADIPDEVLVPTALEDDKALAEWLAEKKGRGVNIISPKRGEILALVGIAGRNAENALKNARLAADRPEEALRLLAEKLKLGSVPRRIECFDISNIGGKYAVGSLVAFAAGIPAKQDYRRFRIRTVSGADDYAMMYEVLKRRYEKRENLPDLIVVDGGKGQLGVALAVLKDLGIEGLDVIGLAKERGAAEKEEDRVYLPGRKDPVYLTRWPAALFLLQRIRDEAHRFAVAYHRKVKTKEDLQSLLDRIPGIGPVRRKAILVFFGDVRRVRAASVEDVQRVEGVGAETARRIHAFLGGDEANPDVSTTG
jgi:excinuclease ABC subunit C